MTDTAPVAQFIPWDTGCLLIGARPAGMTQEHAHYATQICFGSERGIRLRSGEGDWTEYGGAIVPSRQPHAFDATPVPWWAVIFIEPETREGRALAERHLRGGITPIPDDVLAGAGAALISVWRQQQGREVVAAAARRVIDELTGGVNPHVVSDERILRAIAYIRSHLDTPLTLEAVASEAFLSPSRFRHLFVEQTGMGLRPYILWRRFLRVWELMMAGESLSSAAHHAGFADAAHLTRTSRRMFGFPPSMMPMTGRLR